MTPLAESITLLREAALARTRACASAAEVWSDEVFRTLEQRSLGRLDAEARQALSALTAAESQLQQALRCLEG